MDKFKVQDLLEICKELGIAIGPAKRKQHILALNEAEGDYGYRDQAHVGAWPIPCESDYTSPLILVEAPGKNPRSCVDYRRLNAVTVDQTYPILNLEERDCV